MYPEGKKITVAGQEFCVKPFVLRNRTKVLKIVAEACAEIARTNPQASSDLQLFAPALIQVAGEKLVEIYEIVLQKDRDWLLDNITPVDEFEIVKAIGEANDLPFLFRETGPLIRGLVKKTSS
jgi:hypothetical protein